MTETVRLSLDRPEREMSGTLPRAIATASPPTATLVVNRIENPARRAFIIEVELRPPGRPPVRLGGAAPYPPDQRGRYVLTSNAGTRFIVGSDLYVRLRPLNPRETGDIVVDLSITAGAVPEPR